MFMWRAIFNKLRLYEMKNPRYCVDFIFFDACEIQ